MSSRSRFTHNYWRHLTIEQLRILSKYGRRPRGHKIAREVSFDTVLSSIERECSNKRTTPLDTFFALTCLCLSQRSESIKHYDIKVSKRKLVRKYLNLKEHESLSELDSKCLEKAFTALNEIIDLLEIKDLEEKKELSNRLKDIQRNLAASESVTVSINSKDRELAVKWEEQAVSARELVKEKNRCILARGAERAVMQYFQSKGEEVEDVAIRQLDGRQSDEWKQLDLMVSGTPIDVKHSRSESTMPLVKVPKFKRKINGSNITVFGTYSKWQESDDKVLVSERKYLLLGKTDINKIKGLAEDFSKRSLYISDGFGISGNELPSWIFESECDSAQSLKFLQEKQVGPLSELKPIVRFLSGEGFEGLESWEKTLLSRMLSGSSSLTLPRIYLSVLEHFCDASTGRKEEPTSFSPQQYNSLLFSIWDSQFPLLVFDPLCTVRALIKNLAVLWGHNDLKEYKSFELVSPCIFRGKDKYGMIKTLVANCCGCGKYPLIAGKANHCIKCGHLVCPDCRSCKKSCENDKAINIMEGI